MKLAVRLILICLGVTLINGCTFFQDKDEEILPAELVKYDEKIKIQQIWKTKIGKGSEFLHLSLTPSGNSDRIFAASYDGKVTAKKPANGQKLWDVNLKTELTSGPVFGEARVVVIGKNGELICLRSNDGSEVWRVNINSESIASPLIKDNAVMVATIDGQLRSYSIFDGAERWMVDQDMPALTLRGSSAPISVGNNVVAGFDNGRLLSIDIATGVVDWETMLSPPTGKSDLERLTDIDGAIKSLGQDIYAAGYQSQIASIAAESGQILWAKELSSNAGIALDDEYIYAVTDTGNVIGMMLKDGSEIWRKNILLRREVSAPIKYKSTIVVGDLEGYLHFFDHKTGELLSRKRVGKGAISGSPIVIDNYLIVQNESSEMAVFTILEKEKTSLSQSELTAIGGT